MTTWLLAVVAAVVVVVWIIAAVAPETLHFDGTLGPGCDAGNRYCTYRNWLRACDDFTDSPTPARCRFIYESEGGR